MSQDGRIRCSDTTSYMYPPSKHLQEEHEHVFDEVILSLQRLTANYGDTEQCHIDADHYMGALAMLLVCYVDNPVIAEQVVDVVKAYRKASDDWWYS